MIFLSILWMGKVLHQKAPGLGYDRHVRQLDAVAGVQKVKRLWFSLSSLPPVLLGPKRPKVHGVG
jgi:hypothetical protein